jgi:undecaprenyl-diphosphatase
LRKHVFGWSFVCLAGFLGVLVSVQGNGFDGVDQAMMAFVHGVRSDGLTPVATFLSWIGDVMMNIVLAVVALAILFQAFKKRSELVMFLVAVGGSQILNILLKHSIMRARPLETAIVMEDGFAFPSGHSMAAVALYGTLTYLLWKHVPARAGRVLMVLVSLLMIAGIGLSRVYLGVHYPSDVIGGYLLSAAWLLAVIGIFETYRKRKHPTGIPQFKEAANERIKA